MIRRRLVGLAATFGLAALLVGLPWLLLQVGFGTLPTVTSWADVVDVLLSRDDGTLALVVIKGIGWLTWALLAGLIVLEIVARVRGVQPRDLPGLRLPQNAARQLVAAAATLFVALPAPTLSAFADPLPIPTVTPSQTVVPSATRAEAPAAEDVPAAPVPTRQHTVKRGESLWSIADAELGNGRRYTEIAALNTRLLAGKSDDFLRPGWVLTLPVDAHATPSKAAETYTVRKGDTLSEIALDHLDDPCAYPRIFEASRTITQPGGQHLADPDVIDVGWTLVIPKASTDTTKEVPQTASRTEPEDHAAPPSTAAKPTPAGSTSPSQPVVVASPAATPAQQAPATSAAPASHAPERPPCPQPPRRTRHPPPDGWSTDWSVPAASSPGPYG